MNFNGAVYQRIDESGKTRSLVYDIDAKSNNQLFITLAPIPCRNLPIYPSSNDIPIVSLDIAKKFINEKMIDSSFHVLKHGVTGYAKNVPYFYIHTHENEDSHDEDNTFILESTSKLHNFHRAKNIAEYLKQYTIFAYNHKKTEYFNEDNFIIKEDYQYKIDDLSSAKKLKFNNIFFDMSDKKNPKLIVTHKDMIQKLLYHLDVILLNETYNKYIFENPYISIYDFRRTPNSQIFLSSDSLERWHTSQTINPYKVTSLDITSSRTDPFFIRLNMSSIYVLIQNPANPTLENALRIGYEWKLSTKNIGPQVGTDNVSNISYIMFSLLEGKHPKKIKKSDDNLYIPILDYNDGTYGAILNFS
jgi:hypothetical protein